MLSHQKCNGMYASYLNKRASYSHHAERRGDMRLWQWITGFKPFLQWGKPNGDTSWPGN